MLDQDCIGQLNTNARQQGWVAAALPVLQGKVSNPKGVSAASSSASAIHSSRPKLKLAMKFSAQASWLFRTAPCFA